MLKDMYLSFEQTELIHVADTGVLLNHKYMSRVTVKPP